MQASNSTPIDVRYTVENGGGTRGPIRTLSGLSLSRAVGLAPYSYKVVSEAASGNIHFYVKIGEKWTYAASGEFTDPSALVTLVGTPGKYRVEVSYPQVA